MTEHVERARVATRDAHVRETRPDVDRGPDWPLAALFFTTVIALYAIIGLCVFMLVSALAA